MSVLRPLLVAVLLTILTPIWAVSQITFTAKVIGISDGDQTLSTRAAMKMRRGRDGDDDEPAPGGAHPAPSP